MKKFFAVLLAVLMLPVFALAEEAQSVTVKVNDTLSIAVNVPDAMRLIRRGMAMRSTRR